MLGFNLSEDIPDFTDHDISESNMIFAICTRELWHYMSKKIELLKELHYLVRFFNKPEKNPREEIFGVYKKIIRKLTEYFLIILDLGTASFENGSLFTKLKDNAPLIKHFGPIYIYFDEYPLYTDKISEKNI